MSESIICDDLDEGIDHYTTHLGYRLDMITPADAPREALLTKGGETMRLVLSSRFQVPDSELRTDADLERGTCNLKLTNDSEWITGRAGMEYRDLIPDRLGGKVIASHIRLTKGGEVADYVHYHKVDFQMIYCKRGRIRVVYEDQGEPFWLETGDCVLQPPEIRHRVLECTAGAEVIEIGMPAVHETWVEHEIDLPTAGLKPDRDFSGQRFVRHIAAGKSDAFRRDLGIAAATGGRYEAYVQQMQPDKELPANYANACEINLYFRLNDLEVLAIELKLMSE